MTKYLGDILGISLGYFLDIQGCNWCYKCHFKSLKHYQWHWCHKISWGYLGDILGISLGFLLDIFGISWGPLVHLSIGTLVHWTISPLVRWSIGPFFIGPWVHWSIGPFFRLSGYWGSDKLHLNFSKVFRSPTSVTFLLTGHSEPQVCHVFADGSFGAPSLSLFYWWGIQSLASVRVIWRPTTVTFLLTGHSAPRVINKSLIEKWQNILSSAERRRREARRRDNP